MLQEFKDFAMKGNIVDLAVAVIIAAAFGKIVSALVDKVIMPLVGMLMGGVDFSQLAVTVGSAELMYGAFIQSVVDFMIIAWVLFLIVRAINKAQAAMEKEQEESEEDEKGPSQEELLTEIRDLLKK